MLHTILLNLLTLLFKGVVLNLIILLQLVTQHPIAFSAALLLMLASYKLFIFLGFNQKRSIKLSSPYLNHGYYLDQLNQNNPDPHHFYHLELGLLSRPMYCFVCNKNVNGWKTDGLCCDVCGYTVHSSCVSQVHTHCKQISTAPDLPTALSTVRGGGGEQVLLQAPPTTTTTTTPTAVAPIHFPSKSPQDLPLTHHFVHGNHSSISHFCYICADSVGSLLSTNGMHCLWCGLHAHEDCMRLLDATLDEVIATSHKSCKKTDARINVNKQTYQQLKVCNLGSLAKAIIPPYCIYPAAGSTIASSRARIATEFTHSALAQQQQQLQQQQQQQNDNTPLGPKLDYPQLFSFSLPPWCYPLLVIINRKSGGNGGVEKMHDFMECLNPIQVWDLSTHPAELPLTIFKQAGFPFRVLVCGGDGTISSVLHSIDHVFGTVSGGAGDNSHVPPPPVATLPLGTGNDLAQVLGWGGKNPQLGPRGILSDVINGRLAVLDRWDVAVLPPVVSSTEAGEDSPQGTTMAVKTPKIPPPPLHWLIAHTIITAAAPLINLIQPFFPVLMCDPWANTEEKYGIMNNYVGFGLDAAIAHQFAHARSTYPRLFMSQAGNKMFYGRIGLGQLAHPYIRNGLNGAPFNVKVYVDDVEITGIDHLQGLCCLGIKSFGGGACFWGDRIDHDENTVDTDPTSQGRFAPPALDDGKFELIGFENSLHMAMIQTGVALPHRLAQGHKLVIDVLGKLPVQIDGEPWGLRENCRIQVQLRTQSLMITPLHSGPTQAPADPLLQSPLSREVNVTNMLHQIVQANVQEGVLSPKQCSKLMIDFTKQFVKANPTSHFYKPYSNSLEY